MIVVAICNHKGGVGKTTTAINMAAGLARKGFPTLLIDVDPQGNATVGLGIDTEEDENAPTAATLFSEKRVSALDTAVSTSLPALKLIPADIRLGEVEPLLHQRPVKELLLRRTLEGVKDFEYVIVDCPPNLGVLTYNALVASNRVLIPTTLERYPLVGLRAVLKTLYQVQELKDDLTISNKEGASDWRILLTMVSGRGEKRNQKAQEILAPLEEHILKTQIRRTETIPNSQMEDEENESSPIVLKKEWSRGAKDYRDLVKEFLEVWPNV